MFRSGRRYWRPSKAVLTGSPHCARKVWSNGPARPGLIAKPSAGNTHRSCLCKRRMWPAGQKPQPRSEERRVGKEGRCGRWRVHIKKKERREGDGREERRGQIRRWQERQKKKK